MKAADLTPDIPGWKPAEKPPNLRDGLVDVLASRGYATPKSLMLAEVYRVCSDGTLILHVSVSAKTNVDAIVKVAWKHFIEGKPIDVAETKVLRMASGVVHIVGLITETVEP